MDKNAIKKFATWARRELIDRVRQQAYRYGVEGVDADWNASTAHGVVLTPVQRTQRQALIERMRAKGYDATIEEVAYTWFDRFCALRFMEVNGYLPGRTRMFSDENGAFRPQILTNALNVQLDGLDLDTVIRLKEENKNEELFKYLLLTMCNALKPVLTLFQPDDRGCHLVDRDYTWLLLPDNLLREGSVPEQMVLSIPEDDWKDAVQIVGWLYQYYNAEPKDQVFANLKKNIKISKKDIPAATQLFTPDWIVRYMVENSLGRLWVEGHPDHESLKADWKYYLEEAEQEPEVQEQLARIREGYAALKPEDILCIDPCMGSGHILVYLFDVLVQIYEAYGYPTREAVASIVQNNLWGLDIDDRAAQLANFAVMMVARRYDKGWFRRGIQPHVMAIQESNGINRDHLRYLGNSMSDIERNNATTQMEALLDEFIDAKEYGSILQPQEYDWDGLRRFVRMTAPEQQVTLNEVGIDSTQEKLLQIIEQGQTLAQKYHVVITNPPYMGSRKSMNSTIKKFVEKHFPDSKSDLYAVFIERDLKIAKAYSFVGMLTQQSFMFTDDYKELREKIKNTASIINMAHLGADAFEDIGGEVVQTTAFILQPNMEVTNIRGIFSRLIDYDCDNKPVNLKNKENLYSCSWSEMSNIKAMPISYWLSPKMRRCFDKGTPFEEYGNPRAGITTGDNDRFMRNWFEVDFRKIGFGFHTVESFHQSGCLYIPYNKGGRQIRWYGNNDYVLMFDRKNYSILENQGNHLPSRQYYCRKCITWSDISGRSFAARFCDFGTIFDVKGSCGFPEDKNFWLSMAVLNSKLTPRFIDSLNPTTTTQVGDLKRIPVVPPTEQQQLRINELVVKCIQITKKIYDSYEESWGYEKHPLLGGDSIQREYNNWAKTTQKAFEDIEQAETEINGILINCYDLESEISPDVSKDDITLRIANLSEDIRSLISYAVGCMLGRYCLNKPGLQFAGGNWQDWLTQQDVMTYAPDKDGILPITDDEYFSDDIVAMFVEWVKKAFGEEMLEENLKYIASALYPNGSGSARDLIRQYFLNDFYKDHLKIYQKRPIYWMFDSGKKNGFKCLVYMHRWTKDTVARVRTDYVHEMQSRYRTAIEELTRRVDNANGSERVRLQKQLAKIQGQDAELLKYEEKVHHLADQMISIDLDDGVKHNYAIFEDVLAPIK